VFLGIVSGDVKSALHGVYIPYATTISTNVREPFQPFPQSLADPVYHVITEGDLKIQRACLANIAPAFLPWRVSTT
jgi:hypothetical protein